MASQVLSGSNQPSFTYTNNTGGNVRVVINYLSASGNIVSSSFSFSAGNLGINQNVGESRVVVGRNLAFSRYIEGTGSLAANNAYGAAAGFGRVSNEIALPTEVMLSSGQVFALSGSNASISYNIVVIPEAG